MLVVLHLPKLDGVFRAHRHDRQGTAEIIVVEPGRRFRSHGVDQIELVAFRIPDRRLACVVLDLEVDDGEFRVDFLVVENTKDSGNLRVICRRGARVQHQNAIGRGAVLGILGPDDDLQRIGREFNIPAIATDRYNSDVTGTFDMMGSGGGSYPLTLDVTGTMIDSLLFGAAFPRMDVTTHLADGDVILAIDGDPVADVAAVQQKMGRVAREKPQSVVLKVRRGIRTFFVELQTGWKPSPAE